MLLNQWRLTQKKTMRECADLIGLSDARSYQRYECGAQWPGALTIEKISDVTSGMVTVSDLHDQRLVWLRDNRPAEITEAAE